ELARKYDDKDIEAYALGTKGMVHARLGEFAQARENMQRAREVVRSIHSPVTEADVDLFAAWSYLDMGDPQRGLEYSQRGVEKAIATSSMECICHGFVCLGFGNLQAQKLPEAVVAFEESIRRSEISGAAQTENLGRAGLAIAQFYSGRAEAVQDMEDVLANAQAIDDQLGAAIVAQTLGESLTQMGKLERAESYLNRAFDYYRRTEMRPYLARALQSLAHLYERQGRSQDAENARAEAETLMKELHSLGWKELAE
ncbi:MAG: tetratricopeptide repeat protein, partial [Candidatus Bipolaricaulia bacterium]